MENTPRPRRTASQSLKPPRGRRAEAREVACPRPAGKGSSLARARDGFTNKSSDYCHYYAETKVGGTVFPHLQKTPETERHRGRVGAGSISSVLQDGRKVRAAQARSGHCTLAA